MADFELYAADGVTPASLDFGRLFAGMVTSWCSLVLKNESGVTITGTTVEGSDYAVQFLDADENLSSGLDGLVATQTGQTAGTILNNGTVAFQIAIQPAESDLGDQTFSVTIAGTKGGVATSVVLNGSYSVVQLPAQALSWRITIAQPSYSRLHFNEDGTLNPDGLYIEDLDSPGTLILDPGDGSGNYPDIADVMAAAGITFVDVLPTE
jgi:hypothetical protein